MPSEASVKFFDETFFQKSFDLALDFSGRQPEKKLGKQGVLVPSGDRSGPTEAAAEKRPAFPGRRRSCPLSHGCRRASSPEGRAKSRLPLWGRCPPREGGEGNPPPPRTCAILLMSTSGSELPLARIETPGTGPRTCAILSMSTSGSELPLARIESPGTGPPGPKMGK